MTAIDPALALALGDLAQSLDRPDFAELLLGFAGSLVAHDFTTMTRYSRYSKPDYVVHSANYAPELASSYLESYYRFDPFYRYWRDRERPGVIGLDELTGEADKHGRYLREFLSPSGITDEVAIFLPAVGRASIALFVERCNGRFPRRARQTLEDAYPLLAGLYRAHVGALFGSDAAGRPSDSHALPSQRPVLVCDGGGNRVFANGAWQRQETADPGRLPEALARANREGLDQLALDRNRILHGEALDPLVRLAPGGRIWVIEQLAQPPETGVELASAPLFEDQLTPREKEIVALILQGHPTITIAQRLGLSRGTVKNHRRRIYYKLDITSERELFLLHIEQLSRPSSATRTASGGD